MDRPGKPKRVVRVNWERLKEDSVREEFNSHLRRSFSGTPVEDEGIEAMREEIWSKGSAMIKESHLYLEHIEKAFGAPRHGVIPWFAEDGSPNFTRAEVNQERGDDVAADEMATSIVENGLHQDFAGIALAKRVEGASGPKWSLLTCGHRASGVAKAAEK